MENKNVFWSGKVDNAKLRYSLLFAGLMFLVIGALFYLIFRTENLPPILFRVVELFPLLKFDASNV